MDNEADQSKVAYETSPKEVNTNRRMPDGDKQFGKLAKTIPQDSKKKRHKEHR